MPRRTTSRSDQIVALAEVRYFVREIARIAGVDESTVRRALSRRGLSPRQVNPARRVAARASSPRPESASRSAARWLAENGGTVREAATRFQLSSQAVSAAWRVLWPDRRTPRWATSERDDQIVALAEFRYLVDEIAQRVGVSDSTVRRVLIGRGVALRAARSAEESVLDEAVSMIQAGGVTVGDVAARLGIRDHRIHRHLRLRGLSAGHGSTRDRMDGRTARAVARVIEDGISPIEAGALESCSPAGVYRMLRKAGRRGAAR
jgi:predicted transcriptional regulator